MRCPKYSHLLSLGHVPKKLSTNDMEVDRLISPGPHTNNGNIWVMHTAEQVTEKKIKET